MAVDERDSKLHDLRVEAAIRKHSLYLSLFSQHISVRHTPFPLAHPWHAGQMIGTLESGSRECVFLTAMSPTERNIGESVAESPGSQRSNV